MCRVKFYLDYAISFWSWTLSWKYPHFVEISTFRGYFPYFVEISTFRGYFPHFCIYPYFVYIIRILCKYPRSVHIIRIPSVLYVIFYSSSESDWCITYFLVCNLICFSFPSYYSPVFLWLSIKWILTLSGYMCLLLITSIKYNLVPLNFRFACCIGVLYKRDVYILCCMHVLIGNP